MTVQIKKRYMNNLLHCCRFLLIFNKKLYLGKEGASIGQRRAALHLAKVGALGHLASNRALSQLAEHRAVGFLVSRLATEWAFSSSLKKVFFWAINKMDFERKHFRN